MLLRHVELFAPVMQSQRMAGHIGLDTSDLLQRGLLDGYAVFIHPESLQSNLVGMEKRLTARYRVGALGLDTRDNTRECVTWHTLHGTLLRASVV